MAEEHILVRTAESDRESTLECFDGCGRVIVVDHATTRYTVLSIGDHAAAHHWSDVDVETMRANAHGSS